MKLIYVNTRKVTLILNNIKYNIELARLLIINKKLLKILIITIPIQDKLLPVLVSTIINNKGNEMPNVVIKQGFN